MELPTCPMCKEGRLLPLSDAHEPYALWICSAANCAYSISKTASGHTYYKGFAAAEAREKGNKKWTQFEF